MRGEFERNPALVIALAIVLAFMFSYNPVYAQWDRDGIPEDGTIDDKTFAILVGVAAVVVVVAVIVIVRERSSRKEHEEKQGEIPPDSVIFSGSLSRNTSFSFDESPGIKGSCSYKSDGKAVPAVSIAPAIFIKDDKRYYGIDINF